MTTATTMPLAKLAEPIRRVGDYNLIARLSRSSISEVYLAEHVGTGQRVAVKLLDRGHAHSSDVGRRLLAEYTIAQRARHPGLLAIGEAGRSDDWTPFIVMEYLDGENLGELAERGLLDLAAVVAIGRQIAAAVVALHAVGVVHCDLKPENVFVLYETLTDGWPRIKVIDYGVAHMLDTPLDDDTIAGTPHYMAPEQWRGAQVERSDVYSLGCMLFELCTGDVPFSGPLPHLMLMHSDVLAPRASTRRAAVPPELDRLIARTLAKEPAMRPSMSEVEAELARIMMSGVAERELAAVG